MFLYHCKAKEIYSYYHKDSFEQKLDKKGKTTKNSRRWMKKELELFAEV